MLTHRRHLHHKTAERLVLSSWGWSGIVAATQAKTTTSRLAMVTAAMGGEMRVIAEPENTLLVTIKIKINPHSPKLAVMPNVPTVC